MSTTGRNQEKGAERLLALEEAKRLLAYWYVVGEFKGMPRYIKYSGWERVYCLMLEFVAVLDRANKHRNDVYYKQQLGKKSIWKFEDVIKDAREAERLLCEIESGVKMVFEFKPLKKKLKMPTLHLGRIRRLFNGWLNSLYPSTV